MRAAILALVLLGAACGDDEYIPPSEDDAAVPDAEVPDADPSMPDANPATLAPCLDEAATVVRPPTGQLPCDLLPPGFAL